MFISKHELSMLQHDSIMLQHVMAAYFDLQGHKKQADEARALVKVKMRKFYGDEAADEPEKYTKRMLGKNIRILKRLRHEMLMAESKSV